MESEPKEDLKVTGGSTVNFGSVVPNAVKRYDSTKYDETAPVPVVEEQEEENDGDFVDFGDDSIKHIH